MSREVVVEESVITAWEADGWYQRKMQMVGWKGCPDRYFVRNGLWVLIEFKRRDKAPDGHQMRRHRELRDHGALVYVIDSVADGLQLLKQMNDLSDANVHR